MTASLVTPGMQVSTTSDCEAGEGTIEVDGRILATAVGNFFIADGIARLLLQSKSALQKLVTL